MYQEKSSRDLAPVLRAATVQTTKSCEARVTAAADLHSAVFQKWWIEEAIPQLYAAAQAGLSIKNFHFDRLAFVLDLPQDRSAKWDHLFYDILDKLFADGPGKSDSMGYEVRYYERQVRIHWSGT